MTEISVVGGGMGGLVAAITCAERGVRVQLVEAHHELGGRARTMEGDFRANIGPHVFYDDGLTWRWLKERGVLPAARRSPLTGVRFVYGGCSHRVPPLALIRAVSRLRGHHAPEDVDFRSWAATLVGAHAAELLSRAAGVFTFDHDPGRLSAAFVVERGARVLTLPPSNRYVIGGWGALISALRTLAVDLGVRIETGDRVEQLPEPPVIVATNVSDARNLIGESALHVTTTRCLTLDLGLRARRGDPFVVSDLDGAGWLERFTAADRTLAPKGHDLVQGHIGMRPGETADEAQTRLLGVADAAFRGWREREVWRRRQVMDGMTGALDKPGSSWRTRPSVERGGGIFVAGDWVAAPGLLSEVSVASAIEAADKAVLVANKFAETASENSPVTVRDMAGQTGRRDKLVS